MNCRLAYCIGLHQGDGGLGINRNKRKTSKGEVTHEYWYIHYGSIDRYLTEEFNEGLGIGAEILVSEDNRKESYKTYYRVNSHNRKVTEYLRSIGYGERKSVDISKLSGAIKGYEWEFLQGFMDADGYVSAKGKNDYMEWVFDDKVVAEFVYEFVSKFVKCSLYEDSNRRKETMYSVRVSELRIKELYNELYRYKPSYVSRKQLRLLNIITRRDSQFAVI